jgi:hypothetical protein
MGTGILPEQLLGCPECLRKDEMNLKIYFQIAQGPLLSSWSKSEALQTNTP